MRETFNDRNGCVTDAQKQAALEIVLRSNTFARSDQLKTFLKYVCEMEMAGHGSDLTEYQIGVEALGRPSKYSPGDDSAVRNRAFALRKKLQEFYEHEKPDEPIRIELHKGSYRPHFVETGPVVTPDGGVCALPTVPATLEIATASGDALSNPEGVDSQGRKRWLSGFLIGATAMGFFTLSLYLLIETRSNPNSTLPTIAPILLDAWGPLLSQHSDTLVCVANPPNFSVHSADSSLKLPQSTSPAFNDPGGRPMPKELLAWYKARYPAPDDRSHFLTLTTNATYWGDSLGAMTALKTLASAGGVPQVFPEKVVSMPTLRRRNVVLFGAPEYSPAIGHFLEKCPLTVNFLSAIVSRGPEQAMIPLYSSGRDAQNRLVHVYGLITVLPSESSMDQRRRTLIFSGINSAGAQAAAEFFSSSEHLTELRKHLSQEGHNNFPPAYQVVVSAETDDNILLNFKYETHRLIPN
jgi:hypothetical protein